MSYVAIIGGVTTVAGAAIKADSAESAGMFGGGGAGGMPTFSNPNAASYGTTLGNDGWSINFGSGTQIATPSETNTASYPQQQQNPLNDLQPQYTVPAQAGYGSGGSMTLVLLALGGVVLVKALRK